MPGQLQKLLNLVRDPLQVIEDAARANPQRVVRENPDAVRQMAQDFARYVAQTAPEVEHFTYRPLRRLPSESLPYDPAIESVTQGNPHAVTPSEEFWRLAWDSSPNVSFHNHPRAPQSNSLPSLPGYAATGGGGDLGVLAAQPKDSMMGVLYDTRRRELLPSFRNATIATNLNMPHPANLDFAYRNAAQPATGYYLDDALGLGKSGPYAESALSSHGDSRLFRRTARDLKTLDLIDQGRMRMDTNEIPDSVLPLVPGGQISNIGASPEDLKDIIDWHQKVIQQLRRSGFVLPAAATAPTVVDQLRGGE